MRRDSRRILEITALCILSAPAAGQEENRTETVEYSDAANKLVVDFPRDWRVEVKRRASFNEEGDVVQVLTLEARAPGMARSFEIRVFRMICVATREHLFADAIHEFMRKEKTKPRKVELRSEPVPHLYVEYEDPKYYLQVGCIRRLKGYGITIWSDIPRKHLDQIRSVLFRAAADVRILAKPYPQRWPDRDESGFSGLILSTKGVSRTEIAAVKKVVQDVVNRFVKLHGKVPVTDAGPLTVYLTAFAEGEKHGPGTYRPRAGADQLYGGYVATGPLDWIGATNTLIIGLTQLLIEWKYGNTVPLWMTYGEEFLQCYRSEGGSWPLVPDHAKTDPAVYDLTLQQLAALDARDNATTLWDHSVAYVSLLHHGPAKYRKAYRNFLADLSEHADAKSALKKHLYSLDQGKLLAALHEHVKKWRKKKTR